MIEKMFAVVVQIGSSPQAKKFKKSLSCQPSPRNSPPRNVFIFWTIFLAINHIHKNIYMYVYTYIYWNAPVEKHLVFSAKRQTLLTPNAVRKKKKRKTIHSKTASLYIPCNLGENPRKLHPCPTKLRCFPRKTPYSLLFHPQKFIKILEPSISWKVWKGLGAWRPRTTCAMIPFSLRYFSASSSERAPNTLRYVAGVFPSREAMFFKEVVGQFQGENNEV